MTMAATVSALWRYPVKSLQGESMAAVDVTDHIDGDRQCGIFDRNSGRLLSAKSLPALLQWSARFQQGNAQVFVDSAWLDASDPTVTAHMGDQLGRDVEVRPAGRLQVSTIDTELDDGEELVASSSFETQPGWLFDSQSPLHLLSEATLTSLGQHSDGAALVQRYRPNLVIDGVTTGHEDSWVGQRIAIGSVVAVVRCRTERCVVPSRQQPGGVHHDRSLLRYLKQQRQFCVGIYLHVEQRGHIAVGDSVRLLGDNVSL
jgi:uncharacterized protein